MLLNQLNLVDAGFAIGDRMSAAKKLILES